MITIKIQECFEDTNGNVVGLVSGSNTVNKYLVINDGDGTSRTITLHTKPFGAF